MSISTAPPPEFPELPAGIDPPGPARWRPWHALVGIGTALAALLLLGGIVVAVGSALALDAEDPRLTIAGLIVQDLCFVGAAIVAARTAGRVRARDFGLRRPPLWSLFAVPPLWALFPLVTFLWVTLIGAEPEEDKIVEQLGVDEGAAYLVAAAVLICVGAPIVEELFFRGFLFPALRSWRGAVPAALLVGALFGVAHLGGSDPAYVLPLAFFGAGLCFIYSWTRSLYPGIALHALNNSIAFGALQEWDWQIVPLFAAAVAAIAALGGLVHLSGRRRVV